ncbi:MAG: hypothetical protein IT364_11550 [Candidatus Hydrogenedentes bacterium]|nr:hypothetical protein [Candidatus Hydrogenedentota bacterium]
MLKKIVILLFPVVLVIGAVGCGGSDDGEEGRLNALERAQERGRGLSMGEKEQLREMQEERELQQQETEETQE